MKRRNLIRHLEAAGCILVRPGGRHDWWRNPRTGAYQPVPRHREINENLARNILKKLRD
jgi:predicted RNA binding protein YcfA (HicA-like mRNA interferase family)